MSEDLADNEWSSSEVFGEKAEGKKASSDDKKVSKYDGKAFKDKS